MKSTNAIYFDGITSKPYSVILSFDESTFNFHFNINDQLLEWKLEDVKINRNQEDITIVLKSDATQQIKISEESFSNYLIQTLVENRKFAPGLKTSKVGFKFYLLVALLFLASAIGGYIYLLPVLVEKAVVLIPLSFDKQIGETSFNEYTRYQKTDTSKTKTLNEFFQCLNYRGEFDIKLTVIESKEVNAFALPDGHIVVYTGLINKLENYEELAGLMGHEISHVENRHSIKMLCKNLTGYIFISLLFTDINGIMAIIGDNVNQLNSLSYSRKFESEADNDGMSLLINNNINPEGMLWLLKRIQNHDHLQIPEFLSTHPITDTRIELAKKRLAKNNFSFSEKVEMKNLFVSLKKNSKTNK